METKKHSLSVEDVDKFKADFTKEMIDITHSREVRIYLVSH
jgi:hypothetical protein